MRAILPGRPHASYQAVTTGSWDDKQIIAYVSGNAIVVLDAPDHVLQTTYQELSDELIAIVFDEISGKIAAASTSTIYVYKPYGREEGALKWSLQCHLTIDQDDTIETLSWGLDEELLVGSANLTLFTTYNSSSEAWRKRLANPAKFAQFSYDTGLIATIGKYDRLVKIWRRLSSADQRFDYAYLPHPAAVTAIHWRRPFHRDQTFDNVLYTLCADNKLRIWGSGDVHGSEILKLWDEIELISSIQPRSVAPAGRSNKRYVFYIDSRAFTAATERAVQYASNDEREQHALAHLIEVAKRNPDVCVVLDDRGNMSAWGLENVGCKHRKPGDIFNIAHVEDLHLNFNSDVDPIEDNAQFHTFCGSKETDGFTLLVHHFDGRVQWHEGKLHQLFDPSPQRKRLPLKAVWTGHSNAVKKAIRTATGRAMISRTRDNKSVVWTQNRTDAGTTIARKSKVRLKDHIHRVWLLQEGRFIAFLHHDSVSLWDARRSRAREVARRSYKLSGKPLCLLVVPEEDDRNGLVHLATITSEMKGASWELRLPPENDSNQSIDATLEDFATFNLGSEKELAYVLPVDPAGTPPVISGFLDIFARDVAISYSKSGELKSWTARPNLEKRQMEWLQTSSIDTMIENPSLGSGTSIRKAALIDADQTLLTIWNTRGGQLEHEERFETAIQDLDWASTPDNQSILSVGFSHRILVYAQLRYDYLDARPSWAVIREISTRNWTPHPIGDSVWLANGSFVICAGNQLFVQNEMVEVSDALRPDLRLSSYDKVGNDIFTIVSRLNGPLPVFHPQLLAQCMLSGKIPLVQKILLSLWKKLKFWTEGDAFEGLLGFDPEDFSADQDLSASFAKKEMHSSYADFADEEPETVTEDVATQLNEQLATKKVPLLSSREQFHLADIIECVGTVEMHRRSLDENGVRFLLFFRQHFLHPSHHKGDLISWREITWAFHSGSQDILADLVSRHFQGRMLWEHARESGLFMWMTDITALRAQFETIARNEYTKSEEKNPIDCTLYYMALKKKAVLVGLWRMATWSREQAATQRLLSNNFNEPRWRTAALKNAYALMGKRRFKYAAALFLLAGNLKDAMSVLSNQLNDMQLAIAVARVYEGDDSLVLKEFLEDKVLPKAAADGNRWLATWAFWMLGRRDKAVRALVLPLNTLLSPPETPNMQSKLFLTDDPALVVLYKQLREKSLQTLRGALSVSPRAEWDFILHTARLYERMGCDLLALDLVRTWEFLKTPPPMRQPSIANERKPSLQSPTFTGPFGAQTAGPIAQAFDIDPRKLLRRRSSLVVADLPIEFKKHSLTGEGEAIIEEEEGTTKGINGMVEEDAAPETVDGKNKGKRLSTSFQEPDANSLLDTFGF